jgi:hypothetical protein
VVHFISYVLGSGLWELAMEDGRIAQIVGLILGGLFTWSLVLNALAF